MINTICAYALGNGGLVCESPGNMPTPAGKKDMASVARGQAMFALALPPNSPAWRETMLNHLRQGLRRINAPPTGYDEGEAKRVAQLADQHRVDLERRAHKCACSAQANADVAAALRANAIKARHTAHNAVPLNERREAQIRAREYDKYAARAEQSAQAAQGAQRNLERQASALGQRARDAERERRALHAAKRKRQA